MKERKVRILLVEDNDGDIFLTNEALDEMNFTYELFIARNGQEAVNMIFQKKIQPDIVLLDINLPLKSGFEVLSEIKSTSDTGHIPVIMLTTSSSPTDIRKCYELHANSYMCKANNPDDLLTNLQLLKAFWLDLAKLPEHNALA